MMAWNLLFLDTAAFESGPTSFTPDALVRTPGIEDVERCCDVSQASALVAGGVSVHFLQKLAHCIELHAKAFPVSGLQSLHRLIVAIERLLRLARRRAGRGPHFR
jgi:hypothetical protein